MRRKRCFIVLIISGIFIGVIIPVIAWSVCHEPSGCKDLRRDMISGDKWRKNPYGEDVVVNYYINPNLDPTGGYIFEDTWAADAIWDNARYDGQDPQFRLNYAGSQPIEPGNGDGWNMVGFSAVDGVGGTIELVTYWIDPNPPNKVIIEADMEYDYEDPYKGHAQTWITNKYCLRDVATHGFGHFVNLKDMSYVPSCGPNACPDYVSYTMQNCMSVNEHFREDLTCPDSYGVWYTYKEGFDYAPPLFSSHKHPNLNKAPRTATLHQNVPNPANPETWIPFELSQDADVIIRIYNSKGQLIRALKLGHKETGYYIEKSKAAYWDGKNEAGERVSSGVYFYQLQAGQFISNRKMVILK